MKILIFSWRGPKHPNAGGAEIVTHEHAKSWIKAGHDVTLFTSEFINSKSEEFVDGVKVIRNGGQILGVQFAAINWYLFKTQEKFDLVIDQFHGIPFFTPLYVRKKKLAFIHEVTKEVWFLNHLQRPWNTLVATLGYLAEPILFKLFYRNIPFLTVSKSTKKDLVDWGIPEDRVSVVHNGFSRPKNKQSFSANKLSMKKEKKKTVIFLAALSLDKGIEDAINVFSKLLSQDKNWQFWIVGKGDKLYSNHLRKLTKDLMLSKATKFWGYVSEEKKYQLLSKAHFLINTSIREGWGLVVVEAASVATPTIAFDAPGLKDSIIDNKTGLICKERSTQRMAELLISIFDNGDRYQKLCHNAYVWSRKFSWEKSGKESLRLIENLI